MATHKDINFIIMVRVLVNIMVVLVFVTVNDMAGVMVSVGFCYG